MANPHLPPEARDMGHLLYSSLLLLGLNATELEHTLRTPVNQKMFVRMNKKLGETILHFLFVSIDRERAARVFRDCWPMVDRKQEALFHKATFEWYKSLQQSYGQPVPSVVAKTFMAPSGPKFTSTISTLVRIALHSSIAKKAPRCTLLGFPAMNRSAGLNRETLQLLRASKHTHYRNYVAKQSLHQSVINNFKVKAREALSRYRKLCVGSEKAAQRLQEIIHNNTSLSQHQKDRLINTGLPLSERQKDIIDSIAIMNTSAEKLWKRIEEFREVEEGSWKILSPLLNRSSQAYIDGAQYSPRVPDIIYKNHATTINKLKLEGGVYKDEKLNLVSLLQYSNLALTSLYHTMTSTHTHPSQDPSGEVSVQHGRVRSLAERAAQLSAHLAVLLPALRHSVTSARLSNISAHPSINSLELDGKPHLCPPTPPFSLTSTPVASGKGGNRNHHLALHLTPGMSLPKLGVTKDQEDYSLNPNSLSSGTEGQLNQPSHMLTKPDVISQVSHEIQGEAEEEKSVGLSVDVLSADSHGRYLKQKGREQKALQASYHHYNPPPPKCRKEQKTHAPLKKPVCEVRPKPAVDKSELAVEEKRRDATIMMEIKSVQPTKIAEPEFNEALLEKLADIITQDRDDDSGTAELLTTQIWLEGSRESSTVDSGCLEMTAEDTLLEAVEMMNITPKCNAARQMELTRSHRANPRQSLTPLNSPRSNSMLSLDKTKKRNSLVHTHLARLIDATPCGPIKYDSNTPKVTPDSEQNKAPPNKLQTPRKQVVNGEPMQEEQGQNMQQDFKPRMAFLTQTPVKTASPTSFKIQSIYNDLEWNKGNHFSGSRVADDEIISGTDDKEYDPKAKVNILFDQIRQLKLQQPLQLQNDVKKRGSRPNFLSYVENLKNPGEHATKAEDMSNGDNADDKSSATLEASSITSTTLLHSKLSGEKKSPGDTIENYFKSMSKWQNLLGDSGGDDTLTDSMIKKSEEGEPDEEEFASDPQEVSQLLTTIEEHKRSSLLPEASMFDTLTDSILYGESALALLHQDNVKSEIRRESIASRRQSMASSGRLSLGSGKHLQETTLSTFYSHLSEEFSGILDESDSCLLSTSMEDF